MKKVLLISGSLPPIRCGISYHVVKLVNSISHQSAEQFNNLDILSTAGTNKIIPNQLFVDNWKITNLFKIVAIVKSNNPDILHIQYPAVGYGRQLGINLLPWLVRLRYPKIKIIITLHEYFGSGLLGKARDLITVLPAHKIIVSNKADLNNLPKIILKKSSIIPIGATLDVYPRDRLYFENLIKRLGLDLKTPTFCFFGFPFPNKRLEILLEAIKNIDNAQLLLICGITPINDYQKNIIDLVDSINKSSKNKVGITGFLDDKRASEVMQECFAFVSSQSVPINGKSSTAIAACNHGQILVGSGSKKQSECYPFTKENSVLVYPMTASNLAKSISDILDSNRQTAIRGEASKLKERFSWPNIAKQYINLYNVL
jgi:glycosyltransferase involved in cell wall biosynthesis